MDGLVKVVSIDEEFEKGRGKDKKPRKRRGTGMEEMRRENLVGRISEEHGIHPDDMKTIWKRLQKKGNREGIAEEYGIHPDQFSGVKAKLRKLYG